MIRYGISYIAKNGLRTLLGQTLMDERADAEAWLRVCWRNTGEEKLLSVVGLASRLRGPALVRA